MDSDPMRDISSLPVPRLFEAGIFFSNSLLNVQHPTQIENELLRLVREFQISPNDFEIALGELAKDQEETAELTRLLLTVGEATGFHTDVERAVLGAGQKQGMELAELAFLSVIVLSGLFLVFTRGRKEEIRKLKIRVENGRVQIEDENRVQYFSPGESVSAILKQALTHIIKMPDDPTKK